MKFSNETLTLLFLCQSAKYFWIDDVYVTGYLRAMLNITLVDTSKYQMFDPAKLLERKAMLTPDLYLEDYINTLVGRGEQQMRVGINIKINNPMENVN